MMGLYKFIRRIFLSLPTILMSIAPLFAQGGSDSIGWQKGPMVGKLGSLAEIKIPEGYLFAGAAGTKRFLELTKNIPNGQELGVLVPVGKTESDSWFVIFEFRDAGYIKDEEKNKLDAKAILKSIQEGTEEGNKIRKEKGWSTLTIEGWAKPPFYDTQTNNLTWAIKAHSDNGGSVNHSTRILGRKGYMNVDLVLAPQQYAAVLPRFDRVMSGFNYVSGQKYAEFRKGDKVAAIGLTALIAGGAGVALAKSGLLSKFWKLIVVALVAVGAFFKKLFGRGKSESQPPAA